MRLLALLLTTAVLSSVVTLLAVHASRGSAAPSTSVAGCSPPAGARWLCMHQGVYVPAINWSCTVDRTKAGKPLLFCAKGGPSLSAAWLFPRGVSVSTGARPTRGRYGVYTFPLRR